MSQARGGERCEGLVPAGPPTHHEPGGQWRRCERTSGLRQGHDLWLCVRCQVVAHLEGLRCRRCDDTLFSQPSDVWDWLEGLEEAWWTDNAGAEVDAALDEVSWLWHWPYCHYCHHVMTDD